LHEGVKVSKPAKQVIPYDDLLGKVQGLLVGLDACRNLYIDSLDVYQQQVDGANWHVTRHHRSGDDNDWPACWEAILSEVRQLQSIYDVEAP